MVPLAPRPAETGAKMSTAATSDPPEEPDQPRVGPEPDVLFSPAFVRLLGMQAAYGFSFSMFILLPKYLAAAGASPARIGFVMGGFGVACIATIPFLQGILSFFGRRGALTAATFSLAVAGALFALIAPVGTGAIFLRASEGVAWTIMFSTGLILTAEMAPKHRLAQAIGLAGAAALIMNAIAPAIGEPIADHFGYRPVFLIAAGAAVLAGILARRLPMSRPVAVPTRAAVGVPANDVGEPSGNAQRVRIYCIFGVSGLAFSSLFTFLAPYALAHGVQAIRTFFIAYTCAALAVRIFGGRMADRVGHRFVAMMSLAVYGTVVASTGLLGPHHLAVLGFFFGLAHGALFPSMMALLISSTPAHRRPRVLGLANGAMSIGVSAVFPAGMMIGRFGYPATFAVAGGLVVASSALLRRRVGT
jgi:MFS family permease